MAGRCTADPPADEPVVGGVASPTSETLLGRGLVAEASPDDAPEAESTVELSALAPLEPPAPTALVLAFAVGASGAAVLGRLGAVWVDTESSVAVAPGPVSGAGLVSARGPALRSLAASY